MTQTAIINITEIESKANKKEFSVFVLLPAKTHQQDNKATQ